ncbi:MAG: tetratricopeptide repeat protein [Kiritimatiellia bacterium]
MRGSDQGRLALGLVLFGVAAGCRSLPAPPPLLDGGVVSSPALPPDRERAAQAHAFYALGIHHELADDYAAAYAAYRQAAELDPDNERLALRMASTLVFQRQTAEALRTVEEFLRRRPDSESALLWLATFYGNVGDDARVVELFRQLTRRFPARPLGWLQLAAALGRAGDEAAVETTLQAGLAQAQPPTALRQELVRLQLQRLRTAADPAAKAAARGQAIALLRQVAAELPGDVETLYALGDLLVQDEQIEEALRTYEKIERIQPDDPQVQPRLAKAFLAMDDQPRAIAVLEKMAREQDDPADVHFYLAELYLQAGETTNAMDHFRLAANASTHEPAPWIRLAALQAESDASVAAATLAEALEILPENPKILEVFALVRLQQKRYAEAATLLQRAYDARLAQDPESAPSQLFFYNFATVCTHLRRTAEAAEWLRRASEQEPALLDLYLQRALTGTATFRKNAIAVLRALSAIPNTESATVRAYLANLYLAQDRPVTAVREFEAAAEIVRQDPLQAAVLSPRFYFWYGVALDQIKETDRAVAKFETCLALDPEFADALNYLAYLWAVRGERLDEALRHVQTALAIDPQNSAYLDTLGWVHYQQGRYAEALEFLLQADALRPDDAEILDHIQKTREKLAP